MGLINYHVHPVGWNTTRTTITTEDSNVKICFDNIIKILSDKYSLKNVELHRFVIIDENNGSYKALLEGAYGVDKNIFSISFSINEFQYNTYFAYRNNGIIYNSVKTDDYNVIYNRTFASVISQVAIWLEQENNIIEIRA